MLTLHHLNTSRSSRVIWLFEELDIPYELIRYERDATMRAPRELAAVHPLGKAPILQDGSLTLAESASILAYVNERHGGGRLAPTPGTADAAIHDEWLQYAESSAALPIMMTLLGAMTGGLPDGLRGFVTPEVAKTLDYIAERVETGPYLMGEQFTIADIQHSYLLEAAGSMGLLADHPAIGAYLERLKARPAYARTIEVGGPMTMSRG